jgi:hypothetical protein
MTRLKSREIKAKICCKSAPALMARKITLTAASWMHDHAVTSGVGGIGSGEVTFVGLVMAMSLGGHTDSSVGSCSQVRESAAWLEVFLVKVRSL